MPDDIHPLAAAVWFDRVDKIARGDLGTVERSLRHAFHLVQLTPTTFRSVLRLAVDEQAFESLLEAGDFDTAAKYLVAQPTALSVEQGEAGAIRAIISCSALDGIVIGTGDRAATAILDAWTQCVLALRDKFGENLLSLDDQDEHSGRSGQRPRSTLH